jgi:lysophospholipase L1-like esterase
VPDADTVPSYLSRDLNRSGRECVVVTNFGAEGFVAAQELILLSEQLKRGGKPDVVIFCDGFNDAGVGMTAADPWKAHYGSEIVKARAEGSFRGRFDFVQRLYSVRIIDALRQYFRRKNVTLNQQDLHTRASVVLDSYEANHKMALALGQAYHFQYFDFWQPTLVYGNKPLDSFEEEISRVDSTSGRRLDPAPVIAAYREAEGRAPQAGFVFLGNIFNSASESIYIDEAHLGPHGNELVAEAIAAYIDNHRAGVHP